MKTDLTAAARLRPAIPGLVMRPYRKGDAAAISDLFNRGNEADGVNWRTEPAELENWYSRGTDNFDPARDLFIAEVDDVPVAIAEVEWVDTNDGLREYRLGAVVDPAWRRRGIGRWLLRTTEEHARDLVAKKPTERPVWLGTWSADTAVGTRTLMGQEGFEPVRYFFDMVRPSLESIEEPLLPNGLELRPVAAGQLKQLWDADVEAFRDHWGGFDGSETRFELWQTDPRFDPSLFVVAWDGDEIAGGVLNEINRVENEAFKRRRGWLASVFVRRPWRRRGLARALVVRSLEVFRDRGMTSAGLGVDADNPTGALGLYTGTGFEVEFRSTAFRKPLEVAHDRD
jgi:mycothiol synthase